MNTELNITKNTESDNDAAKIDFLNQNAQYLTFDKNNMIDIATLSDAEKKKKIEEAINEARFAEEEINKSVNSLQARGYPYYSHANFYCVQMEPRVYKRRDGTIDKGVLINIIKEEMSLHHFGQLFPLMIVEIGYWGNATAIIKVFSSDMVLSMAFHPDIQPKMLAKMNKYADDTKKINLAQDLQIELDKTKAELEKTKTELDKTKAELDNMKITCNSDELDKTKTELEKTKTELEKTKTELDDIKIAYNSNNEELQRYKFEFGNLINSIHSMLQK